MCRSCRRITSYFSRGTNYVKNHVLRVALEVPVCCTPNVLKENSKFAFLSYESGRFVRSLRNSPKNRPEHSIPLQLKIEVFRGYPNVLDSTLPARVGYSPFDESQGLPVCFRDKVRFR